MRRRRRRRKRKAQQSQRFRDGSPKRLDAVVRRRGLIPRAATCRRQPPPPWKRGAWAASPAGAGAPPRGHGRTGRGRGLPLRRPWRARGDGSHHDELHARTADGQPLPPPPSFPSSSCPVVPDGEPLRPRTLPSAPPTVASPAVPVVHIQCVLGLYAHSCSSEMKFMRQVRMCWLTCFGCPPLASAGFDCVEGV